MWKRFTNFQAGLIQIYKFHIKKRKYNQVEDRNRSREGRMWKSD